MICGTRSMSMFSLLLVQKNVYSYIAHISVFQITLSAFWCQLGQIQAIKFWIVTKCISKWLHACIHIVLCKMYLQHTFPVIGYKSVFQTSAQLTRSSMRRRCVRWSCWACWWAVRGTLSAWRSSRCAPRTGPWSDCIGWGPKPAKKCSRVLESE